jgi:phage-related protein
VLEQMHEAKGVPTQDTLVDKNVLKSENSTFDSDKKEKAGLSSKQKKTLTETFNLFNEMFFNYQKKMRVDEKEKTKVSQISRAKVTPPPLPSKKSESGGVGFGLGALGLLGGLLSLLYGLMTDGPLKGIMKLFSKLGIGLFMKSLKVALSTLGNFMGRIFKFPLKIINILTGGIFQNVFKSILESAKTFIGNIGKGIGSTFAKVLPKGGKGLFGKIGAAILKVLKPAAKLLKRIPIIGTLISVGFAISRFKSGDTVGGIIDAMSGLVGLLDLVVPGLGFGLSLGLDVLNAFLDIRTGGSNPQASKKKGDILWNMAKGLGNWIWDKAEYIPVLGTIKMFGKAYESFKGGNYSDMLKNIGMGLVYMIPGSGLLIDGIGMLMGFFSGEKEAAPNITANKSWFSKLKDWVKSKLKDLPWWIKKPLSWFGIMEDDSGISSNVFDTVGGGVKAGFEKTKEFIGGIWDNIKGPLGDSISYIGNFASGIWDKTKEYASKAWEGIKSISPELWNSVKDLTVKAWGMVKEMAPKVWDSIKDIASNSWNSVKEMAPKVWEAVKDVTSKAWDKTKEYTSDAWDAISTEAPKIWESVKDISSKAWDKAKEAGSWFYESVSSMANKTKDMVNEWIPKIVDTVSGITDNAMKVLKGIADKIGKWISGLFSPEEETKLQESKNSINDKEDFLAKDTNQATHMLIKGSITSNTWLENIQKSSLEQVKLLGMLVNVSNSSLGELKRMSGNTSGGGNTTIISPPTQSPKTSPISIDNNRMGFASSAYSLG